MNWSVTKVYDRRRQEMYQIREMIPLLRRTIFRFHLILAIIIIRLEHWSAINWTNMFYDQKKNENWILFFFLPLTFFVFFFVVVKGANKCCKQFYSTVTRRMQKIIYSKAETAQRKSNIQILESLIRCIWYYWKSSLCEPQQFVAKMYNKHPQFPHTQY